MELNRFEPKNFPPSAFNFGGNISPEALNLTELELNTWKLHDKKLPHTLMTAMADLYTEIYPISKEDAFEILEPWISAVWWHDVAETAEDGRHHIAIRDFAFVPAHIDIRAGDAITWTNEDDTQHSAWDMNDRFDTGILAQGKTATFVFSKPGTYYYRSRPYGETRGTITVTR